MPSSLELLDKALEPRPSRPSGAQARSPGGEEAPELLRELEFAAAGSTERQVLLDLLLVLGRARRCRGNPRASSRPPSTGSVPTVSVMDPSLPSEQARYLLRRPTSPCSNRLAPSVETGKERSRAERPACGRSPWLTNPSMYLRPTAPGRSPGGAGRTSRTSSFPNAREEVHGAGCPSREGGPPRSGSVQREPLDLLDGDLLHRTGTLAEVVTEDVHEDTSSTTAPAAASSLRAFQTRGRPAATPPARDPPLRLEPAGGPAEQARQLGVDQPPERVLRPLCGHELAHPGRSGHQHAPPTTRTTNGPTLLHRTEAAIRGSRRLVLNPSRR